MQLFFVYDNIFQQKTDIFIEMSAILDFGKHSSYLKLCKYDVARYFLYTHIYLFSCNKILQLFHYLWQDFSVEKAAILDFGFGAPQDHFQS